MGEITLPRGTVVADPAEASAGRPGHGLARPAQPRLDLIFGGVRKLEPAPGEQLDPVVLGRIVAGRQHDPEVSGRIGGQEGDGRSRDHTEPQHIHPGAGQARHHGGLQELAGRAWITAHHRHRAPALGPGAVEHAGLVQYLGRGDGEIHGQAAGQIVACHTPDAVRSEEPAHENVPPVSLCRPDGCAAGSVSAGQRFEY